MTDMQEIQTPFRSFSFRGGTRRDMDPSELSDDQYLYLENGRVRYGGISAIQAPLDLSTGLPSGQRQGMFIAGDILFAFANGRCYYRDLTDNESVFIRVEGFQMSPTADRIYAVAIPASTVNFTRKSDTQENASSEIKLISRIEPSPTCIVCQDGETQPFIIQDITSVRQASTLGEWEKDTNREYVPIGLNMLFQGGILYTLSPSRKEIYRSVEGRPLDYVIAVDKDGDKLSDLPANGIEASRMSHAVDYEEITGFAVVSNNPYLNSRLDLAGSPYFAVYTIGSTHLVIVNYNDLIYGQPTFINRRLFNAAALNQYSSIDMLGDEGFVDATGLKSFNSILTDNTDGLNSDFSSAFSFYFGNNVIQDITCAAVHDNYAYFSVKTIYGYRIVVFDVLTKVFVSLDEWGIGSPVFQFVPTKVGNERRMFFMTDNAKVYEAFASENILQRTIFIKEYAAGDSVTNIKPKLAKVTVQNCKVGGTINAKFYVDRIAGKLLEETVKVRVTDEFSVPPYGTAEEDSVETIDFGIVECRSGLTTSFKLTTDSDAEIMTIEIYCDVLMQVIGLEQQAKIYR